MRKAGRVALDFGSFQGGENTASCSLRVIACKSSAPSLTNINLE